MQFVFLDDHNTAIWDEFVEKSPQGSIFATSDFLDGLEANYKIGVLTDKNKIRAGIVLARNEFGAFSNPLLAKYLGILLPPSPEDAKYVTSLGKACRLIEGILEHLGSYFSFDYTFHPAFTNWLPFYWKGYRQEVRYTYKFSQLNDIDKIIQNASSRLRRNLRKAEQNGIYFQSGVDPVDFYRINRLTFERQGGAPPYRLDKIKNLYAKLHKSNRMHLLGAFNRYNDLVSVAGIVNDNRCAYLLFNGSDYSVLDSGANTKLVVEALKYCSRFVSMFDFEGSMIKEIEFFYRSFGAVQTPYFSIWRNNPIVNGKRALVNIYKTIKYRR